MSADAQTVARVDLVNRHEGVLLHLVLSAAALRELSDSGTLHVRRGEDGVRFMQDSTVDLLHGDDEVELVRLEVTVEPEG